MNATPGFQAWAGQFGLTPSECNRICRAIPEYDVGLSLDDDGNCDGVVNNETGEAHDVCEFASFVVIA